MLTASYTYLALSTFTWISASCVVVVLFRRITSARTRFYERMRQLEESERRHRQLVESAHAILWQQDLATNRFTLVNQEAETLLGYPIADWLADPNFLERHSHPADIPLLAQHRSAALLDSPQTALEHRFVKDDGSTIWLRTSLRATFRADGSGELTGAMHDITKTKLLRDELYEQRQYFDALMNSSPDYIYFKNRDSRFVCINRSMANLFNLEKPEDAIGLSDYDFFGEPHASKALTAERDLVRGGEPLIDVEEKETWPDGRVTWVTSSKMPMHAADGSLIGIIGVSRDITQRKLAEIALLEKTRQLEDLNSSLTREMEERRGLEIQLIQAQKLESIGQLAAGIAHEINTPVQYVGDNCRFLADSFQNLNGVLQKYQEMLTTVKQQGAMPEMVGSIEKLSKKLDLDFLSEEIPSAINQSIDGLDRVAQIVRAMKEFSHPGSMEKAPVDLNHAIENTLTVCRNEYKYVAEVITTFDKTLPPVYCLAGEINQVVLNLVVNAAHAIADAKLPSGSGVIRIFTEYDNGFAEVRVTDNGTGIPKAIQDRIFEPFFTTKDVGKGSGQGLALARNVAVKKHFGSLTFETFEGKGTTFILRIPVNGKNPQQDTDLDTTSPSTAFANSSTAQGLER